MAAEDRVLLVDDQPMMGEAVRRVLAAAGGIELRVVSRPQDALAAAKEFGPTVILQDIEMPGIDGFELLDRYRADAALADVPVLMLTSVENAEAKARAFELGANDYMVKFPDAVEMVARVRRHSRARREAVARVQRAAEAERARNPLGFTREPPAQCDVAIVGVGFSGLMTAVRIAAAAPGASIAVFERRSRPGPGVAYGACDADHLLNVPAARMGAFPERPTAFHEWLEREAPGRYGSGDFAPRAQFGRYLLETVRGALDAAGSGPRFVSDAVVHLERHGSGFELLLASGRTVIARGVVLAVGLPQARAPWRGVGGESLAAIPRKLLVDDPWEAGALDGIPSEDTVVVVGSGLTAIDVVLGLRRRGHRGKLVLVSRNGRFPLPHAASHGAPPALDFSELARGPQDAFRLVRRTVRELAAHGHEWHGAIDGVRPHATKVWQSWSIEQRAYFMRRLRPYWEIHRHRVPPHLLALLEAERAAGTLELVGGGIAGLAAVAGTEAIDVTVKPARGPSQTVRAVRIVNCVGPVTSVADTVDPLLGSLLRSGMAAADSLGLGLRSDAEGRLLDAHGSPQQGMRLVGALRRGELWESTAVPELRVQAAVAAESLVRELGIMQAAPA
ncbi:MAG: FAD/NAD(P)-binding protein [Planctomycetota bacterium]